MVILQKHKPVRSSDCNTHCKLANVRQFRCVQHGDASSDWNIVEFSLCNSELAGETVDDFQTYGNYDLRKKVMFPRHVGATSTLAL
ncbi:hypothetical protein MATL_G00169850 [Megalops atlanticus]|uniref:Uncharacterized protein n=1 Tax=Megalops atlanticus TaxID=7932 RepID=A0A9D3T343_MEGAT|nr:hypothetical protein MATL_G00169850 [Megalops atlanticus]